MNNWLTYLLTECEISDGASQRPGLSFPRKKLNLWLAEMQFPAVLRDLLALFSIFIVDILSRSQFLSHANPTPPSLFLYKFRQIKRSIKFQKVGNVPSDLPLWLRHCVEWEAASSYQHSWPTCESTTWDVRATLSTWLSALPPGLPSAPQSWAADCCSWLKSLFVSRLIVTGEPQVGR